MDKLRIASWLIRLLFWLVILICVPLVLTPQYAQLVEEYGMDLPWLTEFIISLNVSARTYGYLYFPLAAGGVLVWEMLLLFVSRAGKFKGLIVLDCLALVGLVVFLSAAYVLPFYMAVTEAK